MTINPASVLVKRLIQQEVVAEPLLAMALNTKMHNYNNLPELLINEHVLSAADLARVAAEMGPYPRLALEQMNIATIPADLCHEKLSRKVGMLPLCRRGRTLYLAVADPTDIKAIEDFEFNTGLTAEIVVVEYDKLQRLIDKVFERSFSTALSGDWDLGALGLADEEEPETAPVFASDTDDQPVITFINKILLDAIRKGASDLHFEPYENQYRIRFRIDGILHEVANPPVVLAARLSARLKVMSQLDIAEKRVPQDGRIKLNLPQRKSVDFRVSTLPVLWGEKVVMRILDSDSAMPGIEALGLEQDQLRLYQEALARPQGMILVTGPTGSGKTVTLYSGLSLLNTAEANISTAEDPVEINLPGVNQVQVNPRAGLTFASALKAFLRQDPDIVMVGEVRDPETAEIAIKAAQTGHLVLSTLHTNSAPETLSRLLNMGVPAYNVASSVTLIIAQRLVRCLCLHCRQPESLPRQELLQQGFSSGQLAGICLYKAVGCEHCTHGYKGRIGVYEIMPVSPAIAALIIQGGSAADIALQARQEGVNSLRQSGLLKVAAGITSLTEINRILRE